MIVPIAIALLLCVALLALTVWGFDQRAKRIEAEDDLSIERMRNGLLHEQVPFPFEREQLP